MTERLNTQLWIDHEGTGPPRSDAFEAIKAREGHYMPKPHHGLWTSTHEAEGSWFDWQDREGWSPGDRERQEFGFWLLDVDPDAKLYTISNYADLEKLVERFPAKRAFAVPGLLSERTVHWLAVSEAFDGVHLTDAGQWATRLSHPLSLYGWDCESTLWFRWRFQNVRQTANPWASLVTD